MPDAGATIAALLERATGLTVLATSRVALRVAGEQVVPVAPLACPTPDSVMDPRALKEYPAVELFVQRAHAFRPDFALDEVNAPVVAEICARLDGLPLAIELAAARLRVLTPAALLRRLDRRLALLTDGTASAAERHRTLRQAIAWSYELLDADEQAWFRRLGVFSGGWTLAAAAGLGGQKDIAVYVSDAEADWGQPSLDEALDRMAALVDHNLIRCDADANGEPRFAMLETLREFALERLGAAGELEAVQQRHAGYYLGLAEAAATRLWGPEQRTWLDRLETEQANLRAALAWGQAAAGWTDVGLRLGVALSAFWEMRGYSGEGRAWLADALERDATATPRVRAWALARAAKLALQQGDVVGAATFGRGVAAPTDADGWPVAAALAVLGQVACVQGDYGLAHRRLVDSLAHARAANERSQMARTLAQLGHLATLQDDAAGATAYLEEGLALCRDADDAHGVVQALILLGNLAFRCDEHDQAEDHYSEGLGLARRLAFNGRIPTFLNGLGELARREGDYRRAMACYAESLAAYRELGDRQGMAIAALNLGHATLRQGEAPAAAAAFAESLSLARQLGARPMLALGLAGLAGVSAAIGQPARAARELGAAQALLDAGEYVLEPLDRHEVERASAVARGRLGAAAFAAYWAEGQRLAPETVVDDALAHAAAAVSSGSVAVPPRPAGMTSREMEVLRLVARGLTSAAVAERLSVSSRTVTTHLTAIYGKLGVTSRTEAIRAALEQGLG